MFEKLKGIVQLLIAAVLVALIVWTNVIPDEGRRIEDAVYAEDAQVLPENEGKRVVVAGTVRVSGYASDPDLGIGFKSLCVDRQVSRLRYREGWEWVRSYDWSTGSAADLTDGTFSGEASIGGFVIDPELISRFVSGQRDWEESDLDAETAARLEADGWTFDTEKSQLFITQTPRLPVEGDYYRYKEYEGCCRVRYRVYNSDDIEATVVGIQNGNRLLYDPNLNATSTFEGILDADEVVKSDKIYTLIGEILFAGIPAALLIFFGVRNLREG